MEPVTTNPFFWIKISAFGLASLFFLVMGVDALFSAYALRNPIEFLILFFASNLMILVSAVGCIHSVIKVRQHLKNGK